MWEKRMFVINFLIDLVALAELLQIIFLFLYSLHRNLSPNLQMIGI